MTTSVFYVEKFCSFAVEKETIMENILTALKRLAARVILKSNDPLVVLFLTLLCFANPLVAQERSKVNDAVDSLRNLIYVAYIGTDGWDNVPKSYTYRQVLARFADDQTLDSLARQYKSSVVKATAGMILIERKSRLAVPLVFDILHNSGPLLISYGDIYMGDNVANFLVNELFEKNAINEQDSLRLNDSLLFASDLRHIERRAKLLKSLPVDDQYYAAVKKMYVEEHDGDALIMLARFHREEDTVYVLENLRKYTFSNDDWVEYWYTTLNVDGSNYYHQKNNLTDCALLAVAEWPHERFKPLLTEIRDSFFNPDLRYNIYRSRYFFSALMAYRSPWALDMIEQTFKMIQKHPKDTPYDFYDGEGRYSHRYGESFDRAYELNPDPYFDSLHSKYGRENHRGW